MITRLIAVEDAAELATVLRDNWDFLLPFEPAREADYLTEAGQRTVIAKALDAHRQGTSLPHVVLDDGRIVGRITLNGIVRGPLLSCSVGYWVSAAVNGRGVATAALGDIVRQAFGELGLHRIEAGTLLDNVASQRVLAKNGFERFGTAPKFLHIAGAWRDHAMFQLINDDL